MKYNSVSAWSAIIDISPCQNSNLGIVVVGRENENEKRKKKERRREGEKEEKETEKTTLRTNVTFFVLRRLLLSTLSA